MGRLPDPNRSLAHLSQRRRRGHANDFGGFSRDQTLRQKDESVPLRAQASFSHLPLQGARTDYVRIELRKEVNHMLKLFTFVQVAADSLRRREEGQTMAEYGVVLAVITLAVIGAITLLSDHVRSAIESVAGILP
jgi:Flp pilus assembly pilin Flp